MKAYHAHESEYRKMKEQGIDAWDKRGGGDDAITPSMVRFFEDVLAQDWMPKGGRVIEFGCGTGAISRWFSQRGYSVVGVDISETAIEMAEGLSKDFDIEFHRQDVTSSKMQELGKFDLAIDGHCLHCLTDKKARTNYISNAYAMLRKGGVFVVDTMSAPLNRKAIPVVYKGQQIVGHVIYAPCGDEVGYEDVLEIEGVRFMPTRYITHWKRIIGEVKRPGFTVQQFRQMRYTRKDPVSDFALAAIKQ